MSQNRTVKDLVVKAVELKMRSGNRWVKPSPFLVPDTRYQLWVTVGNKDGRIRWDDEQYRKDNVDIRIVGKGFWGRHEQSKIVFFTNGTYATEVSGAKYRTSFFIAHYETTNADSLFIAHLKFKEGIKNLPWSFLVWDCGIYASVRNRHWKKFYSS